MTTISRGLTDSNDRTTIQPGDAEALLAAQQLDDPRVFITTDGRLGLCVKGRTVLMPIEHWHELALKCT